MIFKHCVSSEKLENPALFLLLAEAELVIIINPPPLSFSAGASWNGCCLV